MIAFKFELMLSNTGFRQKCFKGCHKKARIGGGDEGEGEFLSYPEGGVEYFNASLVNIFNKCYKKAVFMKNNSICLCISVDLFSCT